ncbi:MAG TPA: amidohydrolase family protein [Gemmatimonadaceae bacterium]
MLALALALASAVWAPADTVSYVVLNHGRSAGEMKVISSGDSVVLKYYHVDRQRGPRSESHYRIANGVVTSGAVWNLSLYGPDTVARGRPADRFDVTRDSIAWSVGDSVRRAKFVPGTSFYRLRAFTSYDFNLLVQHLLKQKDHASALLPGGSGKAEVVKDTTLRTRGGRLHVRFVVAGPPGGTYPNAVWIDDKGTLVAGPVSWFITVRKGNEDMLPAMRAIELAYRNARGEELARKLAPPPASSIAIVNGDVFDSDRGVMRPHTNVIVRGDRIVAVGPADSVKAPTGARVIDAAGKTVMPGMWDVHNHFQVASQSVMGPAQLANGITSVRDMAADMDVAVSLRDRADAGKLAMPRSVLSGFIEGPGKWAGPSEVIVSTEAQAREWIARYDSAGYKQIKLYNLVQQDLVPAIAEEAHKRGMRLSGHVPRGLSTPDAVRLGFDEINHAAFLFSTFYPDSLYVPVMRAYSTVSQIVAPNVDINGPEMTAMIQLFKEKGTVIDGTWNLWLSTPNAVSAAVAIPSPASQMAAQKSDSNYVHLLKKLFDEGVTLIPGTDGSSYNVELELYEKAGIPAPEVLRIATIVPAKVMHNDKDYGSIAVGKVADIAIVDGKPAEHVADLRRVERVLRAGRVYEARALRAAIGFEP